MKHKGHRTLAATGCSSQACLSCGSELSPCMIGMRDTMRPRRTAPAQMSFKRVGLFLIMSNLMATEGREKNEQWLHACTTRNTISNTLIALWKELLVMRLKCTLNAPPLPYDHNAHSPLEVQGQCDGQWQSYAAIATTREGHMYIHIDRSYACWCQRLVNIGICHIDLTSWISLVIRIQLVRGVNCHSNIYPTPRQLMMLMYRAYYRA